MRRRSSSRLRSTLAAAATAALACVAAEARAADVRDSADGPTACHDFEKKNERELERWEKKQPSVAYEHPREDTVLNAPWGRLFKSIGKSGELILATIIPHAGAQLRGSTPAALISWPWQIPFGPAYSCTRNEESFWVKKHRAHRALIEPGIVSSNRGTGVNVRPGYRFVYHPTDWVIGLGGGLGSTIELAGQREPFRFSVGPEVVAHFGHCCDSSYFTFAVRYDHFFKGDNTDILGANLGYTFF